MAGSTRAHPVATPINPHRANGHLASFYRKQRPCGPSPRRMPSSMLFEDSSRSGQEEKELTMTSENPGPASRRATSGQYDRPNDLTLAQAAQELRTGKLASTQLVEACLARIAQVDGELKACVSVMSDT